MNKRLVSFVFAGIFAISSLAPVSEVRADGETAAAAVSAQASEQTGQAEAAKQVLSSEPDEDAGRDGDGQIAEVIGDAGNQGGCSGNAGTGTNGASAENPTASGAEESAGVPASGSAQTADVPGSGDAEQSAGAEESAGAGTSAAQNLPEKSGGGAEEVSGGSPEDAAENASIELPEEESRQELTAEKGKEQGSPRTEPIAAEAAGLRVTVLPTEEAALPEDTTLEVSEITPSDSAYGALSAKAREAAWRENGRVEDISAALPYAKYLSISLKHGDETIEPAAEVGVEVELTDSSVVPDRDGGSFGVLHFTDDGASFAAPDVEESGSGAILQLFAASGDAAPEDDGESHPVLSFRTEQFSDWAFTYTYTVDFYYEGKEYSLPGGGEIRLAGLMQKLGLSPDGTVTEAVYSTPDQLSVGPVEDGDCTLESRKPFTSKETLTLTTDRGTKYVIPVCDPDGASEMKKEAGPVVHDFDAKVFYGGTEQDGRYVWTARSHAAGHRFSYRVSFGLGDEETGDDMVFAPGTVKITVPKTILVDREGKQADHYEMSVPSMEEVREAEDNGEELDKEVLFAYKEDGDQLVITNIRDIDPGFDGFIEMSYLTSEETFAYKDMAPSKEFTATITAMDPSTVKDKDHPDGVWTEPQTKTVDPVYIDTQVKLASMEERVPAKYDKWQSSWGTAPETVTIPEIENPVQFNPDDYTYFVYEICSRIGDNSQEYAVSINDTISRLVADGKEVKQGSDTGFAAAWYNSKGSYAIGQKSSEPKGQYEKESGLRYDYVILAFDKNFITNTNKLEITNDTTETVHPRDDDDNNSQATSQTYQRRFVWNKPVFRGGGGGFGGWVRADGFYRYQEGRDEWPREYFTELGNHAGNYSGYNLNDLTDDNKSISGLDFAVWSEGYIGSWSVDRNVTNPNNASKDNYYKEPVRYEVTDNCFYLTDENDGVSSKEADRLKSAKDYQIDTLRFNVYARDPVYDENTAQFVGSDKVKYEDNEELVFEVQTGSTTAEFKKAAVYNLQTREFSDVDFTIVKSTDATIGGGPEIQFHDGVVGYRVTTKNKHYYFRLGMVPSVTLKASTNVLSKNKTASKTNAATQSFALNNKVVTTIYDYKNQDGNSTKPGDQNEFTHVVWGPAAAADADFIRKVEKESSLTKDIVASTNLQKKKEYRVTWKIHADESYNFGENEKGYVEQKSGTFYDLLPVGAVLDPDSVLISTNDGDLPSSSFKVDTEETNYNNTGRTLVKISVYDPANWYDLYYDTVHTYESIRDYGNEAYNSVAYQTGNDSISDFYKETGEHTEKNKIREEFDLYQSDTEAQPEKRDQEKQLLYSAVGSVLNKKTVEEVKNDARLIFRGRDGDIAAITSAASGLSKKILSDRSSRYDSEAIVDNNGDYHYQLRFQNSYSNSSEEVVLYDALENYNNAGRSSDWHGTLTAIDFSALPKDENGNDLISPVVYYSTSEQNYEGNKVPALSSPDWNELQLGENGAVPEKLQKNIRAIAIDLGKGPDGQAYQLDKGQALTVSLTMKAPAGASRKDNSAGYPEAYNGVAVSYDRITDTSSSQRVSQVGCTRAKLVISRDVNLEKRSSKDNTQIRGISFRLSGTSDYGTAVDKILSTDRNGELTFARVEKGTYTLMEYGSVPDWLDDHTAYTVKIDDNGRLWITNPKTADDNGSAKPKEYVRTKNQSTENTPFWFTVYNDPRIHADLRFYKARQTTEDNDALTGIPDTTFELSGTSDYGNDVVKTATSDSNGLVKLDNIEKGTYTLREIKANADYILNSTPYQVRVDEAGTATLWKPVEAAGKTTAAGGLSNGTTVSASEGNSATASEGTDSSEAHAVEETDDEGTADNNADAAVVSYTAADTIGEQPVIFNTPAYWDISFLKVDKDLPTRTLQGATFRLSGVNLANSENAESDANGRVTFKHLKSGSYVMKEIQAPAGVNGEGKIDQENGVLNYTADASDYLIELKEDGTYTIRKADSSSADRKDQSGSTPATDQSKTEDSAQTGELSKNADGDYLFPDERALDGQITIIKKWEDDGKSDSERPQDPVIHLFRKESAESKSGVRVVVEWLNDTKETRPLKDFQVVVTDKDSNKKYSSNEDGVEINKTGNIWTYYFKDLKVDKNYTVIETGLPKGYSAPTAVTVQNGFARIQNSFSFIQKFEFTGKEQSFTAPYSGYYQMEVWGAAGGKDDHDGGKGGYSTGTVYLSQGDKLYVYVGGVGLSRATGIGGGWNGGGDAGNSGNSGGGGGMTHISTSRNPVDNKAATNKKNNRGKNPFWNPVGTLIVAGGGGGGGYTGGKPDQLTGGFGGGETAGKGGANEAASNATHTGYMQGYGQNRYDVKGSSSDGGGAGAGWYGGYVNPNGNMDFGGGGGTGYVAATFGQHAITGGKTIAGNESFPATDGKNTEQGHAGNGYAKITFISENSDQQEPVQTGSQSSTAENTDEYKTDITFGSEGGWSKVDASTWKYTLPVFDDTATYTYWEDPITGYTSDAQEKDSKVLDGSKSKTLVVTNTADSAYGSLTVSKKVVDSNGNELKDSTQDFTFTLTLTGSRISGTQSFGGNVFANGQLTFTLHEGQGKIFDHIPAGTLYTVSEAVNENYNQGKAPAVKTGTVAGNTKSEAAFENTFTPKKKTRADVALVKRTEGSVDGSENDAYPFHAELNGLDPNLEFSIQILPEKSDPANGEDAQTGQDRSGRFQKYMSDETGHADVTLELKSNERAVFRDLPVGAQYRFIEDAGKWTARFEAADAKSDYGMTYGRILQTSGQNTEENQELATQTETVEEGEKTTVTFINTLAYAQKLTVKKTVTTGEGEKQKDPNERFEITVTITGLKPGAKIDTDSVGILTADDTGEAAKTFYLKNGQSAVFRNIPVSAKYQVKETANDYVGSYQITAPVPSDKGDAGTVKTIASGRNDSAKKDLNTAVQTIRRGEDPTVELISGQRWTKVTFRKQDKDGKQLKGAIFTLYRGTGKNRTEYRMDRNGSQSQNGSAVINLGERTLTLPSGVYQLEETRAPKGYIIEKDSRTITFGIKADGTIALLNADGSQPLEENSPIGSMVRLTNPGGQGNRDTAEDPAEAGSGTGDTATSSGKKEEEIPAMTIINRAGTRLPSTGGMDVRILLLAALAMVGSALFGFHRLRREDTSKKR